VSRKLLHGAGELLVTLSVLIFLYFVYSAWFTNVTATAKQTELSKEITKRFEVRDAKPLVQTESQATEVPKQVTPIGLLYIPRLQDKVWGLPIVQGVGHHELSLGVGHYPSTELPGELGNFAIAGHRATNGEPFAYFERLKADDLVYVRTQDGWFEYQLLQNKKIQESETWVLSDRPKGIDTDPNSALITLTTCDPRWNSYQRWAWWGVLTKTYPAAADPIGAEAGN
jgi:sortase A